MCERSEKTCERNNSADTQVGEEEGRGGALGDVAVIPPQPMERIMIIES